MSEQAKPVLRIVHGGEPTADELAALTIALATVAARTTELAQPRSRWNDRGALLRRPLHPGPGAWRHSVR